MLCRRVDVFWCLHTILGFRLVQILNIHSESERSKPSSRDFLIGEQPNPWDLLQPQDKSSRHRGAEPCRRYGRLGTTSLLSPGLLLSGNLRPHLTRTIGSLCSAFASVWHLRLTVKLVYAITLSSRFPFAINQP